MAQSKVVLIFVVLVAAAVCLVGVNSQLTFTPNWGKRESALNGGGANSAAAAAQLVSNSLYSTGTDNNCKTSMDSMLVIYRLIQSEASRILACSQGK